MRCKTKDEDPLAASKAEGLRVSLANELRKAYSRLLPAHWKTSWQPLTAPPTQSLLQTCVSSTALTGIRPRLSKLGCRGQALVASCDLLHAGGRRGNRLLRRLRDWAPDAWRRVASSTVAGVLAAKIRRAGHEQTTLKINGGTQHGP